MSQTVQVPRVQQKSLQRLAEAGCTNAARGLSEMTEREVRILNTMVDIVPFDAVPAFVGGADRETVGICLAFEGDIEGYIALILPTRSALELVDMLVGAELGETKGLGDLELSALAEAGNIAGSFFLNAVSEIKRLVLRPSPPLVLADMAGAVLDSMLLDLARDGDSVLLMETMFVEQDRQISACFFIMPRTRFLSRLLASE